MTHERLYLQGAAAGAAAAFCWSFDGVLLRIVEADAWQALFWRMSSYTIVLTCVFLLRHPLSAIVEFRSMGLPGVAVAVFLAAANALFVLSIELTKVANTLFVFATVPIFSAVLGWIVLRESLRFRTAIAILIGIAAVAAIFAESFHFSSFWGDSFAALAALFFAANLTVVRAHPDMPFIPPLIVAGAIATTAAFFQTDPLKVPTADIFILVASGGIQQTVGVILVQWAARLLPPAEVGLLAYVETVFGPLWVWLAVAEVPSRTALAAGGVILVTLSVHYGLALQEERRMAKRERYFPQ